MIEKVYAIVQFNTDESRIHSIFFSEALARKVAETINDTGFGGRWGRCCVEEIPVTDGMMFPDEGKYEKLSDYCYNEQAERKRKQDDKN